MAICALCLNEAKLCRSHIVPEFIFSKLYGPDHEYHILRENEPWRVIKRSLAEKLLCRACEDKLCAWETYASKVLYGGTPLRGRWEGSLLHMDGLEYKPLKLFLMSLLWRAGATTIKELRADSLGPHQETLRTLLMAEDPAEPWRYGCFFIVVVLGNNPADLILAPSPVRHDSYKCWRLFVGGFLFSFVVSGHPPPKEIHPAFLQENGTLVISREEIAEVPYLVKLMASVGRPTAS
jgi:hypothetical protein